MNLAEVCNSIETLLEARALTHNERVYWTGWLSALVELGEGQRTICDEWPNSRAAAVGLTLPNNPDTVEFWRANDEARTRFAQLEERFKTLVQRVVAACAESAPSRPHCAEHPGWRSDCDACAEAIDLVEPRMSAQRRAECPHTYVAQLGRGGPFLCISCADEVSNSYTAGKPLHQRPGILDRRVVYDSARSSNWLFVEKRVGGAETVIDSGVAVVRGAEPPDYPPWRA